MIPKDFIKIPRQSRFSSRLGNLYMPADQVPGAAVVKLALALEDGHAGGPGRGHGGVTLTLLDEAMGRAASEAVGFLCTTASISTRFYASTRLNSFVIASAKVSKRGKHIVFVEAELHDADQRLVAAADGIWSNTKQPIPEADPA